MQYFAGWSCDVNPIQQFGLQLVGLYVPLALVVWAFVHYLKSKPKYWLTKLIVITFVSSCWVIAFYIFNFSFTTCHLFLPIGER